MARICLISRTLTPALLDTAMALTDQKNTVTILTSRGENPPIGYSLPVWTYFKKWNLIEGVQILPKLLQQDIVHFVFQTQGEGPSPAHLLLASTIHALPFKLVAGSFWQPLVAISPRWLRVFFLFCNLVTTDSRANLNYAKRKLGLTEKTICQVHLPSHQKLEPLPPADLTDLSKLTRSLDGFVFIPDLDLSNNEVFSSDVPIVHTGHRVLRGASQTYATGSLDDGQLEWVISQARAVVLSTGHYTPRQLKNYQALAFAHRTPLIVRTEQMDDLPGLVKIRATGWVVPNAKWSAVHELLKDRAQQSLDKSTSAWDISSLQQGDDSINQLERLYERAFDARWR